MGPGLSSRINLSSNIPYCQISHGEGIIHYLASDQQEV